VRHGPHGYATTVHKQEEILMALSGDGYDVIPASLACTAVGGLHARDQRTGNWQQGVKRHDIVSTRRKIPVNVRSTVGVTGGAVFGATGDYDAIQNAPRTGKNARKRAMRANNR
jgi:hypothetical protein